MNFNYSIVGRLRVIVAVENKYTEIQIDAIFIVRVKRLRNFDGCTSTSDVILAYLV